MGMFDNYNNQNTNYIPNNLTYDGKSPQSYPIPYTDYNAEEEKIGYYWYYGDTVNLSFDITGEMTVESNSIIYYISGQYPTINTVGELNQKAYNVADLLSWTLTAIEVDEGLTEYIWTADDEFENPQEGDKQVYITASDYIRGMTAQIKIHNFRYEVVYTEEQKVNSNEVTLSIGKDLSDKLVKGTYYITLTLIDEAVQSYIPLLKDKECVIDVR